MLRGLFTARLARHGSIAGASLVGCMAIAQLGGAAIYSSAWPGARHTGMLDHRRRI